MPTNYHVFGILFKYQFLSIWPNTGLKTYLFRCCFLWLRCCAVPEKWQCHFRTH